VFEHVIIINVRCTGWFSRAGFLFLTLTQSIVGIM